MRIFCVNRDVQDQKRYDPCRFGPISKAATSSWSSVPLGSIFRVYCYVGLPGDELTGPNGHIHYSDRCLRPWEKQVPRFSKVVGIGNLPGTHFVHLWRSSARLEHFHQWQLSMAPAAAYYCGVDTASCEGIKSTKTGRLCAAPLAVQKRYCAANAEGRSLGVWHGTASLTASKHE